MMDFVEIHSVRAFACASSKQQFAVMITYVQISEIFVITSQGHESVCHKHSHEDDSGRRDKPLLSGKKETVNLSKGQKPATIRAAEWIFE